MSNLMPPLRERWRRKATERVYFYAGERSLFLPDWHKETTVRQVETCGLQQNCLTVFPQTNESASLSTQYKIKNTTHKYKKKNSLVFYNQAVFLYT